jgi:uncharacterized protein GlcG (DUF336 family)
MSIQVKRLSLDSALKVAQASVKACREKGIQIGVTVVDRNGIVQVVLRDSLAPPFTLDVSKGKARAAVFMGVSTEQLAARADSPIGRVPGVVMSTGGLVIEAGGTLYGAVGVSGAPSGETDAACAQVGIEEILEDLEMSL